MKKTVALLSMIIMIIGIVSPMTAYADDPIDISTGEVTLSQDSYVYSGSAKEPEVALKVGDENLTNGTDFSVEYTNNINAGTATAVLTGIGNYTGTVSKDFTISPYNISGSKVKVKNTAKIVAGKKGKYEVYYDNQLLKKGTDYTIDVKNYKKAGVKTAKVTVSGVNNFEGTKTKTYNVYPRMVTSFTTKDRTTSTVTISWKSQSSYKVSGYKVYTCDKNGNNLKFYKKVSSNSCKVTKRAPGSYSYFVVKAFKKSGNTTIYGANSKIYATVCKPKKVTIKSVLKSKDSKKLTISWKRVNCTGYEIFYSTDKAMKKNVKTIKAAQNKKSVSVKIPKNSKVYYAKVRAYREYNLGKYTVYGKKSEKFSTDFSKLYATYTSAYVNNPNRTTNLILASKAINGTIVYPGQTFSLNKTVGKRTTSKGYRAAYIFTGPTTHTMGVGGGVCQVASTMFNAALLANFKIVERHQHSQRVTYVPLGRDAAIYWGAEDFKFKNNTNYPVKIVMYCKNGKITCSYYVCNNVSPKKVKLNVYSSGRRFTLQRSVNDKVNYTTRSYY